MGYAAASGQLQKACRVASGKSKTSQVGEERGKKRLRHDMVLCVRPHISGRAVN